MTDTTDKIIIQSETQGVSQSTSEVQGLSKAMDGVTVASQNVEKSTTSVEGKFAALERRFSTTAGQASQLEKVQRTVNTAVAQNPELQDRANAVLAAAEARYAGAAVAGKALAVEQEGLSTQGQALLHSFRSVAEQLALGIPPTQALAGQFNHLTYAATGQGGLSGAFGEVTGLLGRILTPMRLVGAGIVGVGAAALLVGNNWQESAGQIDRALAGIGQRTGETVQSINKFSTDNATATGLSVTQARNVALEFTKTGNIAISGLKGVGDAIHGYAVLTGKDASDATKEFAGLLGGDLVKGAERLNQTYGVLNSGTIEYIRTLELQGDRSKAIQVILDALEPTNLKAAQSVGILSKAYTGLSNVISNIFNGVPSSTSDTDKLAALQAQRAQAASAPSLVGANPGGYGLLNTGALAGGKSQQLSDLDKQIDDLQKKIDAFNADRVVKQLNAMSMAGDAVVRAIIPQIDQINNLEKAIEQLRAAQNTPGVSRGLAPGTDDEALTAAENQLATLRESEAQSARYNERVKDISSSWGDVGQSTALALQAAQNQLPVLEAVGGAAKMSAQYAADYANYIDQGKTATEAAALAAANLKARQAQINSAASEQLAALQDQYVVSAAMTPQAAAQAQGQATYNNLVRQGVDETIALATANQQVENALARIWAANQKVVRSTEQQVELAEAQGTDMEAAVKSSIAYDNAIQNGATSAQAAAISVNTLTVETIKAADAAQQYAQQWEDAQRAAYDAKFNDPGNVFGYKQPKDGITGVTALSNPAYQLQQTIQNRVPSSQDIVNRAVSGGNLDSALQSLQGTSLLSNNDVLLKSLQSKGIVLPGATWSDLGVNQNQSDIDSAISSIYDLKLAQAGNDNTAKASVYKDEISYYEGQPQTLETMRKIADLKNSLDALKDSTDALTTAEQASLNPLYNGRDALKVGYYHAASGLDMVASGPTSGDQIPFHAMVNGGEHIQITPAGQSASSNDNSKTVTQTINISLPPAKTSSARRSQRQYAQGYGQMMAALS